MRRAIMGSLATVLIATAAVAGCSREVPPGDAPGDPTPPRTEEAGPLVTGLTLPDLDGRERPLSFADGSVTVLNFWATWCVPCLREIPELVALHRDRSDEGLGVVGIAVESGRPSDIRAFATEKGMIYPIVTSSQRWARKEFDLFGLPLTLIVDREGVVRRRLIGPHSRAEFEAAAEPFLTATDSTGESR
ncbi:MAG: TlpA disulfide reductase family protein [Longimicrobiales bacterium]|nr:TlpA disulfide reductase family protein [Longimicrobiales bacterium]